MRILYLSIFLWKFKFRGMFELHQIFGEHYIFIKISCKNLILSNIHRKFDSCKIFIKNWILILKILWNIDFINTILSKLLRRLDFYKMLYENSLTINQLFYKIFILIKFYKKYENTPLSNLVWKFEFSLIIPWGPSRRRDRPRSF